MPAISEACKVRNTASRSKPGPIFFPLMVLVNCQATDDHDRHWVRHVAPNAARRMGVGYGADSKSIIAGHLVPSTDHVGTRSAAFLIL